MEEKKNGYGLLIVVFCVLLIVVGVFCFYLGKKNSEPEKELDNDTKASYIGAYGRKAIFYETNEDGSKGDTVDEDEDGEPDFSYDYLSLREDGSFYLSTDNFYANQPSVGTYKVDGKTITMTETVTYGSDACFYTENLKTYTATIIDDKTISITINGAKIDLTKGIVEPEDKDGLAYYVTNPKDGVTPDGWEDAWVDCSKLTRK